jgi:hypothetical protein
MKSHVILVLLILLISPVARSQEKYVVGWEYYGQSFQDFVARSESEFHVRFFYNEEWTKNIRLGNYGGKRFLNEILDTLYKGTSIYWYNAGPGNIMLTKDFAIKPLREAQNGKTIYVPGMDNSTGSRPATGSGNLVADIGNPSDAGKAGNATITGYVTNQGEALAGVTVYVTALSSGTTSNAYGFYKLTLPKGSWTVRFTFVGMKEKTVDLNIFGSGDLNLEMKSVLVPLKEAVIRAGKDVTIQRLETGIEKINVSTFRLMPTSMGESDIVKSVLLVPGVQSVGEGSAGFNVRGGSADQNLILLYGAPMYNSSHFFGFFSAVNSDIIRDATLYKGGIPARFGGRLSSVLDIVPRDGNRKEFAGNAGISPVTTHFVLEGPIKQDTFYYLITARTTYSNWILGAIDNPSLKNSKAAFHDINVRVAYDLDRKNKIDFSAYYSDDSFKLNSDSTYKYLNNIISVRWRHYFSSRFFSAFSVNNSYYRFSMSSLRVPQEAFEMKHRINSTGIKADFNWFPGRNEINFGTDITRYDVLPGNTVPASDSSIVMPWSIEKQRAIEAAVYFEDKFTVTNYFSVVAGGRFASFYAMGPHTVYEYNPGFPVSSASVADTISFGRMKNYKTYSGPELRLSANLKINRNSSFRINYNYTRQYIHLLSNTASISPTDTWKLCDYNLKPQAGGQLSAGYYTTVNKNKIEVSAEIYFRKIKNMADFKGGTELLMNEFIERDVVNVSGKSYGLELLVRKPQGRTRWSVSYTYSRALIRSTGTFAEDMINGGAWFPANFDRPHDLICTFNYLHSRRVSISANYNYSSGRPVTYPVTSYKIGEIVVTGFSERNQYRLPYYSRLDISIIIRGNLKIKKIAHPNWIFSIYNLTGRDNVYSVFFKNVNNSVRSYYLSVFNTPIPTLSFNFDF